MNKPWLGAVMAACILGGLAWASWLQLHTLPGWQVAQKDFSCIEEPY